MIRSVTAIPVRRAMTLIEMILALSITIMVGLAIASMMGIASAGVTTHKDIRARMLRAHVAQTRLLAYVAPSRCVLDVGGTGLVIWFRDTRQGDTIHASEVRWVSFDEATGRLNAHWVHFPAAMNETTQALEDHEFGPTADWWSVLSGYQAKGWTVSGALVDGLTDVQVRADQPDPLDSRQVELTLIFADEGAPVEIPVSATIQQHEPPAGS